MSRHLRTSVVFVAMFTLACAASSPARADDASPPREPADETLIGDRVDHGGYGAPMLKVTSLANTAAMLAGAEGGWLIGHRLILGGGGYGLATDVTSPGVLQPAAGNAKLSLAYGGLRFGLVVAPRSVVHVVVGTMVGGGSAASETSSGAAHRSDTFWVVEPDVAAEANLAKNVRLVAGVGYRFVGGTEVPGLTAGNLSGFAGGIGVKFGVF